MEGRNTEAAYVALRQIKDICRGCDTQEKAKRELEAAGLWYDFVPGLRFYRSISDKT